MKTVYLSLFGAFLLLISVMTIIAAMDLRKCDVKIKEMEGISRFKSMNYCVAIMRDGSVKVIREMQ